MKGLSPKIIHSSYFLTDVGRPCRCFCPRHDCSEDTKSTCRVTRANPFPRRGTIWTFPRSILQSQPPHSANRAALLLLLLHSYLSLSGTAHLSVLPVGTSTSGQIHLYPHSQIVPENCFVLHMLKILRKLQRISFVLQWICFVLQTKILSTVKKNLVCNMKQILCNLRRIISICNTKQFFATI